MSEDTTPIYKSWEEAQEALDRGETVRIECEPFTIPVELLRLARELQDKERLQEWKKQNERA
jgi:hypothetical protein